MSKEEGYEINERIRSLINHYNVSRYRFAQDTGISESVLRNVCTMHNKPSIDAVEKILVKYKDINGNWLVTGEGGMFRNTALPETSAHQSQNINRLIELVERLTARNEQLQGQLDKISQERFMELTQKLSQHPV